MIDKSKMMTKALKDRKARGLDLTIVIGGADPLNDAEEQKKLGLAPEASDIGKEQDMKDVMESRMMHDKEEMPGEGMMADHQNMSPDMAGQQLIDEEIAKAGLGKGSVAHSAHAAHLAKMKK